MPDSIKEKITEDFSCRLVRNLLDAFDGENIADICFYQVTTATWLKAFSWTIDDTKEYWMKDYHDSLEWWMTDQFRSDLTKICIDMVIKKALAQTKMS